jgi:phage tail tape-measure protein
MPTTSIATNMNLFRCGPRAEAHPTLSRVTHKEMTMNKDNRNLGAHPVGTGIGAIAGGAAAGAATGTVVGPVGTVVGAAIGAVVGGLAGKEVAEEVNPTRERAWTVSGARLQRR